MTSKYEFLIKNDLKSFKLLLKEQSNWASLYPRELHSLFKE
jgi:hypothetical protein